jgi:membrane fusion protein
MANSLFRTEAVEHQKSHWLGSVLLARPLSFTVWTLVAATCATLVVSFFIWGTYAKKARVVGFLQPALGIIKVHPREGGTVIERHVREGQLVNRGDILFVLSNERASSNQTEVHASIGRQLETRKASLQGDLDQQKRLRQQQESALIARIDGIRRETSQLERETAIQQRRLQSLENQVETFRRLHDQKFMSSLAFQQKQDELLDQQARYENLARGRLTLARDLASLQNELRELPLRSQVQLANVERSISAAEQEITENEARRRIVIHAPEAGVVTAVLAEVGQMTTNQIPLLSIVPKDSVLVAHLFAPSSAIGFIAPGHDVLLRYQAFPYQKFGQHSGKIVSVSRTALPPGELPFASAAGAEPMYRIEVALTAQSIVAYGQAQTLHAGMQLEADVLLDTRRLIEWVFDPLYSLSGRA